MQGKNTCLKRDFAQTLENELEFHCQLLFYNYELASQALLDTVVSYHSQLTGEVLTLKRFTSLCCFMFVMTALIQAEDKLQVTEKGDALPVLFDGKTLKNWKITDFGGQGDVRVEDGMLVLDQGEPITGIHWTGAELPTVNYELQLEAQRIQGSDFFCAVTFPVQEQTCSLVLGGWGGGVIGLSSIDGFDASENETTDYYSFEDKKWYKVRLRVTDKKIEAWLDGDQIANVDYSDKKISVRIEMELSKPLGIASFQTTGGIRNLRISKVTAESLQKEADAQKSESATDTHKSETGT